MASLTLPLPTHLPIYTCREQLKDRQRFIVVSVGQRLLQLADMIA
jgi:hypothetical protein